MANTENGIIIVLLFIIRLTCAIRPRRVWLFRVRSLCYLFADNVCGVRGPSSGAESAEDIFGIFLEKPFCRGRKNLTAKMIYDILI